MILNRYFDNAATSFPKPPEVALRMTQYMCEQGGTYGRAAYPRVMHASADVEAVRDQLAQLIGASRAEQVIFTANATDAANMLIHGLPRINKVLHSPLEHHAVMRPLHAIACTREALPAHADGRIDLDRLQQVNTHEVSLVVVNAVSNVNGVIQPLDAIGQWAQQHQIPWAIDAAQAAGVIPLDVRKLNCDFLFLTAHKALLGPTGIGALYLKDPLSLHALRQGGSGSGSQSFEMPALSPERFEAGTPNMVGILGWGAALKYRPEPRHTRAEFITWMRSLREIPRWRWLCAIDEAYQSELLSFIPLDTSVSACAASIQQRYGIELRSGWHCAALAHQYLKSDSQGSLRLSLSPYHSQADLEYVREALYALSQS